MERNNMTMSKPLQTDIELFAAALSVRIVSIWLRNKPIQILENVTVREITPYIVTVYNNEEGKFHFMRSAVNIRAVVPTS